MELKGIEKALKEGCKLHGFRSGGGLRVIRLEDESDNLRGYGEHPTAEDALFHANEDFLAGGRPYDKVYGGLKPHYLTGSQHPSTGFDEWLLQGRTIDAYLADGKFVVELKGLFETKMPKEVYKKVKETGKPAIWENRGYTYQVIPDRGDLVSLRVLESAEEEKDAWMYRVTKTGQGQNFFEALNNAVDAEAVEDAA